jgi:radical SAM protein with 4Fe4S-binding SPASM domain
MDDIENILKLGKGLGIRSMKFNPVIIMGNALKNKYEVGLDKDDMKKLMHKVPYFMENHEEFTGILRDMYEMALRREKEVSSIKEDSPVRTFVGCKMAISNCVIRGDGWVIPCDRLWDIKAGNIREESFLDIWNNSKVFNDIRKKFSVTIDVLDECKDCEFNKICTGGCPATLYDITGDIWGHDHISCFKFISECLS